MNTIDESERAAIQARVDEILWFHDYEIVPGVRTHGMSLMKDRAHYFQIPEDLTGKRVLDVGCADGYFTFLAESRGAEVVSIDSWPRQGFFLAHEILDSKAQFHHMNVYDINPEQLGTFDIVFFFGVYYHLKNPILALERIASVTREYVIVESEVIPPEETSGGQDIISRFYERDELGDDPTNWWVPSMPCLLRTVRAAGFPRAEVAMCYQGRRGIVRGYKGPHTATKVLNEDFFVMIDQLGKPRKDSNPPTVNGEVLLTGWAVRQLEPAIGIDKVTVFLDSLDDPSAELGQATYGMWRTDQTLHFGEQYGPIGFEFMWDTTEITQGEHTLHVLAEGQRGWHYRSVSVIVHNTFIQRTWHKVRRFLAKIFSFVKSETQSKGQGVA